MSHGHEQPPLIERLRQDIVDGVFIPRERLVEADLAERYGVNRSALRVALLELASEGLVEREPMRGARVRALSIADGIEVAQVRRELESLCAGLAAIRATDEERLRLREIVDDMHEAFAGGDQPHYLNGNSRLHTAIRHMSRHHIAEDMLTRLGNLNLSRHFPLALNSPISQNSDDEHEQIAAAIIRGDQEASEQLMYAHLDATIKMLESLADSEQAYGRSGSRTP